MSDAPVLPRTLPVAAGPAGPWWDRAVAVAVIAAAAAAIVLLLGARPDARGFGTHEQLGMLPCSWPATIGAPCPTCGVTTAACHVVHLQLWSALRVQPFGFALTLFGLWLAARALWSLLTATSFLDRLLRVRYGRLFAWAIGLLAASWLYLWLTFRA